MSIVQSAREGLAPRIANGIEALVDFLAESDDWVAKKDLVKVIMDTDLAEATATNILDDMVKERFLCKRKNAISKRSPTFYAMPRFWYE